MCYFPKFANFVFNEEKQKYILSFLSKNTGIKPDQEVIQIPCGKCIDCLNKKSTEWGYRLMFEQKDFDDSCLVTLTYSETDFELHKEDLQKFLKRLRKHFNGDKIRYFACGEYGSEHQRPHYHIALFGAKFDDIRYFKLDKKKNKIYRSKTLESLWKFGFSSIVELNLETAKYCTKYMTKLINYDDKKQKPFLTMSLKPGIGWNYASTIIEDMLLTDKIYYKGNYIQVPRYYLDKAEKLGYNVKDIRLNRQRCATLYSTDLQKMTRIKEQKEKRLYKNLEL